MRRYVSILKRAHAEPEFNVVWDMARNRIQVYRWIGVFPQIVRLIEFTGRVK